MIRLPGPCVCLVTDRRAVARAARTTGEEIVALERQLDEAIAAGIDLIQIRERDLDARSLATLTSRVVARASATGTCIVVNDRADVAVVAGAHGVHVRSDGPDPSSIRALSVRRWMVGRSVHTVHEAAAAHDADYQIFGTVFASASKPAGPAGAPPVAGIEGLRQAAIVAGVPVLAIGGITPARVKACRLAGAAGVAAIGVFLPAGSRAGALGASAAVDALRRAWYASD